MRKLIISKSLKNVSAMANAHLVSVVNTVATTHIIFQQPANHVTRKSLLPTISGLFEQSRLNFQGSIL